MSWMIVENPAVTRTYRGTPFIKFIAVTRLGRINGRIQIKTKIGANM